MSQGGRENKSKAKLSYLDDFPHALKAIAKVCEYGSEGKPIKGTDKKGYGKRNWKKGLPITEVYDSQRRHEIQFFGQGILFDQEALDHGWVLHHLAMASWNSLAKLEMYLTRPDMDDRALTPTECEDELTQGEYASTCTHKEK